MTSPTASDGGHEAKSNELTVNLQIKSPSAGVSRPLLFSKLPPSTTIKHLKAMIRDALPMRPEDKNQRLIYRGRAITTDSDTLLNVIGADLIQTSDQHTIHMVLKHNVDANNNLGRPTPTPTSTAHQTPSVPPHSSVSNAGAWPSTGLPPLSEYGSMSRGSSESTNSQAVNAQSFGARSEYQSMSDWLRDVANRSNQQSRPTNEIRGRMPGMEDPERTAETSAGRASSAPGHTIYRETIGPYGRTYQVSTVQNFVHQAGNRLREEQGLLEEARRVINGRSSGNDAQSRLHNLHRSASGTSLYSRPLPRPGVTTPSASIGLPRRQAPEQPLRSVAGYGNHSSSTFRQTPPSFSLQAPYPVEVYVLSSPEGPRALLVNNNTSETYYTPRLQNTTSHPQLRQTATPMSMIAEIHNAQRQQQHPLGQQPPSASGNPPADTQQAAPQAPVQRPDQGPAMQQAPADAQPLNRAAAAFPPLLVRAWPHIWGMLRAGFFFWAFTTSDSPWVRWGTIVFVTLISLLMSTGTLGNLANRIWQPIGQQIENLLPTLEHPHRRALNNVGPAGAAGRQDPNPVGMAQRLVAERQNRDMWLPRQLRRIERASLLFLASIAPGVAERHIANLEAEARAERERVERERREAEESATAAEEESKKVDTTATQPAEQHSGEPSQRTVGRADASED